MKLYMTGKSNQSFSVANNNLYIYFGDMTNREYLLNFVP